MTLKINNNVSKMQMCKYVLLDAMSTTKTACCIFQSDQHHYNLVKSSSSSTRRVEEVNPKASLCRSFERKREYVYVQWQTFARVVRVSTFGMKECSQCMMPTAMRIGVGVEHLATANQAHMCPRRRLKFEGPSSCIWQ